MTKAEEIALIARCVAFDDHRAFACLVDEYSPAVRRYIFNLTLGDAALTDDLAQETFIKAYMGLRSFKGMARFSTWLYSIAWHEFVDHTRRTAPMVTLDDVTPSALSTGHAWSGNVDARHDIEAAMAALSPNERTAVLLFYLNDRPIKEIARITRMPQNTIKSHLLRAKQKMAKFFEND